MRQKVTMACTECKNRNYQVSKNRRLHPDRLEQKKYCRFCGKHTLHRQSR